MTASNLTPERLRELLRYDPKTGLFTRRKRAGRHFANVTVGWTTGVGYTMLYVDGKQYYAHRLAFLYVTGNWPTEHVDHLDHVRTNNQWSNLRDVHVAINNQNFIHPRQDNKLKVLGVIRISNGRFRARMQIDKKGVHIGYFDTAEEAHAAYVMAKRRLHSGNLL